MVMLDALRSYTPEERASVESFLETYVEVIILAVNSKRETNITLMILFETEEEVQRGYKQGTLSVNTYTKFYRTMAEHFIEHGFIITSFWFYKYILYIKWDECFPDCDFFSISVAHENIGIRELAFHFRQLAYHHQYHNLEPMSKATLLLQLYNDYSDASLSNDLAEAREFTTTISQDINPYLLFAGDSEFSREVYHAARKYFKARNMREWELLLQAKMLYFINKKEMCKRNITECLSYTSISSNVQRYKLFQLVQISGNNSSSAYYLRYIIGKYYYSIGDYSKSQKWLTELLELVNTVLKQKYSFTFKEIRCKTCYYLILSGNFTNFYCYGYIIKDMSSLLAIEIMYSWRKPENHTTVEQKRFTWDVHHALLNMNCIGYYSLIVWCFILIPGSYIISVFLVWIIANFMYAICSDKQKACCMSLFFIVIHVSMFITVTIYLLVLFLDIFY